MPAPFSAGDLLKVTALRRLGGWGMIEDHPNLAAYLARGEARPAGRRAFDAQRAVFIAASRRAEDRRPIPDDAHVSRDRYRYLSPRNARPLVFERRRPTSVEALEEN